MAGAPAVAELAVLAALAASTTGSERRALLALLDGAGLPRGETEAAIARLIADRALEERAGVARLTPAGIARLLDGQAEIAAALDPCPPPPGAEACPSVPYLTLVQTTWIDALSINYAVDPAALAGILPPPLEPEIWQGSAWVQLLVSSLRDMRPQGMAPLFGVCFYQASYRAAVRYRRAGGWRRGGYFVRSDTNHPVMRTVGNALVEFKFHHFGLAEMLMVRDGNQLTLGIDPVPLDDPGKVVAIVDTRPLEGPPPGSVWSSVEALHQPLVECYDALGVDAANRWLYLLTIDRDPWNPRFVRPEQLYVEWMERGPLAASRPRLDSVLHFRECGYRWRPLRRERL